MFKIENMTQEEVDDLVYDRDTIFQEKKNLEEQLTIANNERIRVNTENLRLQKQLEYAKAMLNGEWVDTDKIQTLLGINFGEGLKRFDFSRTAEWNPAPLNGQKITTKFKLKLTPI